MTTLTYHTDFKGEKVKTVFTGMWEECILQLQSVRVEGWYCISGDLDAWYYVTLEVRVQAVSETGELNWG